MTEEKLKSDLESDTESLEQKVGEEAPNASKEKTLEKIKVLEEQVESLQAQKEHFREKTFKLGEELEELKINTPIPSEKELANQIPDWDILSPTEQQLHKEVIGLKKDIAHISKSLSETSDKLKWEEDLSKAIKKFPQLQHRKDEFELFCYKGENVTTPIEILAKSFLFEEAEELGAKEEKEKTGRVGLERGTAGEKLTLSPEMTEEEVIMLRKTNPKRYFQLIKEGKIPK